MAIAPRTNTSSENYRYGFNGKEKDCDIDGGTVYDYGFRIYDPRIARFLSEDPLSSEYPELTPYQFGSNRPVDGIDQDGLEWWKNFDQGNFQVMIIPQKWNFSKFTIGIQNKFDDPHHFENNWILGAQTTIEKTKVFQMRQLTISLASPLNSIYSLTYQYQPVSDDKKYEMVSTFGLNLDAGAGILGYNALHVNQLITNAYGLIELGEPVSHTTVTASFSSAYNHGLRLNRIFIATIDAGNITSGHVGPIKTNYAKIINSPSYFHFGGKTFVINSNTSSTLNKFKPMNHTQSFSRNFLHTRATNQQFRGNTHRISYGVYIDYCF
jgi:RHS repeat-associated protein